MISIITLTCLVMMVIPAAVGNILAYPVSKKLSVRISNYIVKVLAPRFFAILKKYRKFNFWGYNDSKKQLPENFTVISNHQSLIDIPVYMNYFHEKEIRFVAKDQLARHIPLVSEMLRAQQHCMIPRKARPMDAMNYIEKFGKRAVEKKQVPVIFPEGTRTKDRLVGKFYSAGFRMLEASTNLPVAVCALDGGYSLRSLTSFFRNLKRGCYRVKVLKVYNPPKSKEECNKILEEARVLIQNQLDEWKPLSSDQK
ncbi:MAG: 1-acyl-sn-glycerol-3-phosphate acyltransferase [Treponema sp.]|nr:1-acyl-sn-glycerol-3-phosphate acyltransferase [Treponema sp.]